MENILQKNLSNAFRDVVLPYAKICNVKISEGQKSGVKPFLPRLQIAVLCDGIINRDENLKVVDAVKKAVGGHGRAPSIAVMTDVMLFGRRNGIKFDM